MARFGMRRAAVAALVGIVVAGCSAGPQAPHQASGPSSPPAGSPAGNAPGNPAKAAQEVVLYLGGGEYMIQPLTDAFTRETGIAVKVRTGSATELANQIGEEQKNPQADLIWANDAGTLEVLRSHGLLVPNDSPSLQKVPGDLRAEDGSWVAVTLRARVIMYNTNLVKDRSTLPKSVFDLTDPRWKGKIAMGRSSSEYVIGNITALRMLVGDQKTSEFLTALMKNNPAYLRSDTMVRQAVGREEFALGWVNHYYYFWEKADGSPVDVVWPDQKDGEIGSPVNIRGVGIVKGGPNPENAKKLVEYLLRPEVQQEIARRNWEIASLPGVPSPPGVPALNEFKRSRLNLTVYGREWSNTINLLEKVGLP